MIDCYIQATAFANDVGEVIRLFYPMEPIEYHSDTIGTNAIQIFCELKNETAFARVQTEEGQIFEYGPEYIEAGQDALEQKRYQKRALKHVVFGALEKAFPEKYFPWGCLTGIRPTKMVREMLRHESEAVVREKLHSYYFVKPDKIDLAMEIVAHQMPILQESGQNSFDLYVGIPFCRTRCVYCSFAAYALGSALAKKESVDRYLAALEMEIRSNMRMVQAMGYALRSVYIGGGTPTALSCEELERVLRVCNESSNNMPMELTVEAGRPDTIDREKLHMLKRLGVTRISINPQTIHDDTLRAIGRAHTYAQFVSAYEMAREAGFSSINVDLIAGLPGETIVHMQKTMREMERLRPDNLTIHTLSIKRSADLKQRMGQYELPDAEEAKEMVAIAQQSAAHMALKPYYMYRQKYMRGDLENVGYAMPGLESRYNIGIMEETQNILALGAGAISKWIFGEGRLERQANPKDIRTYCDKIDVMTERRRDMIQEGKTLGPQ